MVATGLLLAGCATPGSQPAASGASVRTIVFVWDGLRPDSVSASETPNLWALRQQGVWFADNHSTFPTFTMMNASAFATGSFPATTGFYGNTLWQAGPKGSGANAAPVDFNQPVFTEDWSVLDSLNAYYGNQLYLVGTLFQAAQAKGLVTATVGKSGAAYIQDYRRGGYILDENLVAPKSLAAELQAAGFPLPKNTPNGYPAGAVPLASDNGDPTGQVATVTTTWPNGLKNGDPTDTSGAKATAANAYMMKAYLEYILPNKKPDLSLIWFRDPDTTQHAYGPGSGNYHQALRAQDQRLGELLARLKALGLDKTTNVIVATDHAHSNVSGPPALFPLRAVANGKVGAPDSRGYSSSGDVRTADLITRARLGVQAFDGAGCLSSAMAGLKANGTQVYPVLTDTDGSVCGKAGTPYQTRSYTVPATLAANAVVIAANGGSDYLYVPSHDPAIVAKLVRFLQTRTEYGPIFVASRYGAIPGTVPMTDIKVEGTSNRNPDIVVSFDFDPNVVIAGLPGIEFESFANNRGMHGSFSPVDVHNALIASGPSFRSGIVSELPSGNVDLAPTLSYLLGTSLPQADGRVLVEALKTPPAGGEVLSVTPGKLGSAAAASGLKFQLPTNPDGTDVDGTKGGRYSIDVYVKDVKTASGKTYRYFDHAKATRQ
jgi:predicted AlkP superfamily pyrophosphatase or phosphodiesterase